MTTTVADIAPRTGITRAVVLEPAELRDDSDGIAGRTLVGHFAVFDEMTEIRSPWEGEFRENISPGAFTRTMNERRDQIRCIYAHGHDPSFGAKPIGTPRVLEEDGTGARYEVDLYANAEIEGWIIPAARDGQLGASFAFDVISEGWDLEPADGGLPIRTISELRLYEFGPCPFPAYADATAGVRSALASWSDLPDDRRHELALRLSPDTSTSTALSWTGPETDGPTLRDSDPPTSPDDLQEITNETATRERELRLRGLRKDSPK